MNRAESRALRSKAMSAVHYAIHKTGRLDSLSDGKTKCTDCDAPASEYDHRNYYKKLDVQPVCRLCNCVRGPGYPHYLSEDVA